MKSETKKTIEQFINDSLFFKRVVIFTKKDCFTFPESVPLQTDYFNRISRQIFESEEQSAQYAAITREAYLFFIKEQDTIFVCECSNNASLSQVKMEFSMFVEDIKKQIKNKKFFKSIFDW